jgi:uncharacterized membrane protein
MSSVPPPPNVPPPNVPPPPGGPSSGPLDVGTAVSYAWKKFQQFAGPLIGIVLVIVAVELVGGILRFTIKNFFLGFIVYALFFIVAQILTIGIINAALMITRGETPAIGTVFATEYLGPFILASIIYGAAVFVGTVLCIIPGILAAIFFGFYGFYVLDQHLGAAESIAASFNLVKEHFGRVFLVLLVAFLLNLVGALLCGIGLLVTAPMCWIMFGYAYRWLNGQPIAP